MASGARLLGLKELQEAFAQMPASTARGVKVRVLTKRLQPVIDAARAKAPKRLGHLKKSFVVTTVPPKGQESAFSKGYSATLAAGGTVQEARAVGRAVASAVKREVGSPSVRVWGGPGRHPQGTLQEFGTRHHRPQSFLRPIWDAKKENLLDGIAYDLRLEVEATANRVASRAAKRAARQGTP